MARVRSIITVAAVIAAALRAGPRSGGPGRCDRCSRTGAEYKACENIRLHSDPCSTTSILTTSY